MQFDNRPEEELISHSIRMGWEPTVLINAVSAHPERKNYHVATIQKLVMHARVKGRDWGAFGRKALASELGFSRPTLNKAIDWLVEHGFVHVEKIRKDCRRSRTRYHLLYWKSGIWPVEKLIDPKIEIPGPDIEDIGTTELKSYVNGFM